MPKKRVIRSDLRESFNELNSDTGFLPKGKVVNQGLLDNLKRQPATGLVRDSLSSSSTADIEELVSNTRKILPPRTPGNIEASDINTQTSPITQQGYSGQTFTMPTIAAEGLTFPFHILSKAAADRREQEAEVAKQDLSYNYDIAQISDEIHAGIFVDRQSQYYSDLLLSTQDALGGDRAKALKYLKDNNIIKTAGVKWKNLETLYNKTFESYLKVKQDPGSLGASKFDPKTKKLADEFGAFIGNPDNFDPDNIDKYAKFFNQFNERASLVELARTAAADMVGINPNNPESVREGVQIAFETHAEGLNLTEEQEALFKEMLPYYYKYQISEQEKSDIQFAREKRMQEIKARDAMDLQRLRGEQAVNTAVARAGATSEAKKPKVTIDDQKISVTDPTTNAKLNINAKDVVTFPSLKSTEKLSAIPGDSVYVEGTGWLTINEKVDIVPIRQFKAKTRDVGGEGGQVFTEGEPKEKGKLVQNFFVAGDDSGEGATEREYVLAEINAPGTTKVGEEVVQDIVNVTDRNGKKLKLGGKVTVLVPVENIKDILVNKFGEGYDKKAEEKKTETNSVGKKTVSVAKYNKEKNKNLTKEQLAAGLDPDKFIVVD